MNKKRVVSTLFLYLSIFSLGCDFESPQKWETPSWYLPLTLPLVNTVYSFEGMVDSSIIFSDSLSSVIQIEFVGSIPGEGADPLGIPDSIFNINMESSGMEIPDMEFGSGAPIPIPMPDPIPDAIDAVQISMASYATILDQFGCLPITDPSSGESILESIVDLLPATDPQIFSPESPDLGIDMFSLNSIVISEGEWNFGIINNLFFDLDTAYVLVSSGSNLLYEGNLGPVLAGNNPSDTHTMSTDDSLSWNIISLKHDLIATMNIGVDPSQEGKIDCLWNEDAPPLYACKSPAEITEAILFTNEICDNDNDGVSECTEGSSNCSLLYFCAGNGYVGKTGNCKPAEYYGNFSSFSLSGLTDFITDFEPDPVIYQYTSISPLSTSFHFYDPTCNDQPVDEVSTTCDLFSGTLQTCTSDCVEGFKEPKSGWDVSGDDEFSIDIDFTNSFNKVRKVNISSSGWDTTITIGQAFPGFEGIAIKQAKINTYSNEYPNKLSLDITNGLFANFILQFDFINFFDEITEEYLSETFIIPPNNSLIDSISFSENILAYGLPSDQVIDSMVFNIKLGFSEGEYSIFATDNQITVGSPEFNEVSMSNLSLQYIEAITDSLGFPEIPSPPIEGIPDGFSGFEFYDIIMEMDFFNEIGIPVSLNMELNGTKEGVIEEKKLLINPNLGAPYDNYYCCNFNKIGDTVRTIIRLNREGQTTEYYCTPEDEKPSCICPGSDCLCAGVPCCSEDIEDNQTNIVDFMNFGPEKIAVNGAVTIDGTGILAPGSNIWGTFKLIAPLAFIFEQPINIIPAEPTPMAPMDPSTAQQIDSALVEAALNVTITNNSPLGGNLSLLISDSTIFPLFLDSLTTGSWDSQLFNFNTAIWDTLDPPMVIDSISFTAIDPIDEKSKALEVKFYNEDSLQFFIGRMFELGFPRADSIEYHLGYANPEFPNIHTSGMVIDTTRMAWVITEEPRYNIAMMTFDSSPIQSITDTDTAYIPLTFQTTNTIGVQAYLTLTLDTGGLGRDSNSNDK